MKLKFPALLTMLLFVVFSSANAITVLPISEKELTKRATIIVTGVVEDVYSAYNPEGTTIYTYITVDVTSSLKGDLKENNIILRQVGGMVGDRELTLPGAPDYEPGDELLVFAGPFGKTEYYGVLGIFYGKYDIKVDPSTGKKTVNGSSFTVTHVDPETSEELPRIERPDPFFLDNFISEINSYLLDI
jgi:hypothetical protein